MALRTVQHPPRTALPAVCPVTPQLPCPQYCHRAQTEQQIKEYAFGVCKIYHNFCSIFFIFRQRNNTLPDKPFSPVLLNIYLYSVSTAFPSSMALPQLCVVITRLPVSAILAGITSKPVSGKLAISFGSCEPLPASTAASISLKPAEYSPFKTAVYCHLFCLEGNFSGGNICILPEIMPL